MITTVPAQRLLIFDVADGWEPLCEFLDVAVPDRPFPRVNDKTAFQQRLRAIRLASRAVPAAAALGVVALRAGARRSALDVSLARR